MFKKGFLKILWVLLILFFLAFIGVIYHWSFMNARQIILDENGQQSNFYFLKRGNKENFFLEDGNKLYFMTILPLQTRWSFEHWWSVDGGVRGTMVLYFVFEDKNLVEVIGDLHFSSLFESSPLKKKYVSKLSGNLDLDFQKRSINRIYLTSDNLKGLIFKINARKLDFRNAQENELVKFFYSKVFEGSLE